MKPGFDVQRLKIKERTLSPDAETSELTVMPHPAAWGAEMPKPKNKGGFVLIKGSVVFERLHVRMIAQMPETAESYFPEEEEEILNAETENSEARPLVSEKEESPLSEPPKPTGSAEDVDDYRYSGDTAAIKSDLSEQIKNSFFRLTACGLACLFLIVLEILPAFGDSLPEMLNAEKSPMIYLLINAVLVVFALVLQRGTLISGVKKIFAKSADSDSVIFAASVMTLVHIAAQMIGYGTEHADLNGDAAGSISRVFSSILLMTFIINDIALMLLNKRIERNFMVISQKKMHNAVMLCQDTDNYYALLSASGRNKSIIYRVKAKFLSGFLRYSYERDACESKLDRLSPYALIFALAAAAIGWAIGGSLWNALTCFCAVAVIAVPACRLLTSALPLFISAARLQKYGVMFSGWAAVDEFSSCNCVAVSAADLFPKGSVHFIGAKTFTHLSRNEIILYAASLAIAAGGTLGDVLDEEIGHQRHRLYDVEQLRYEHESGLEGHVNSRRVLVGTREMLEKREIDIPGRDHESRMRQNGNHMIYIAISGKFAGAIALDYRADARTENALAQLVKEDVSFLVCTRDPNVTTKLVSDTFDISRRHITMLGIEESTDYEELTNVVHDRCPAVMSCDRGLASFAHAVCASKKLAAALRTSTLLQLLCYIFGIVLVTVLCCMSGGAIAYFPAKLILPVLLCVLASLTGLKGSL